MLSNCDLVSNVSPLLIFCRYQMKCKSVSNVSPRYTLLPDMTAHALYQRKYRQYQDLIEALQGYHARIKEHAL